MADQSKTGLVQILRRLDSFRETMVLFDDVLWTFGHLVSKKDGVGR